VSREKNRARRPGVRATAGLIVEGDTEFSALPRLYTKKLIANCPPLKAINLNGVGSHLEPSGIAARLLPKVIEHQQRELKPIIACLDREQREMTASQLAKQVFESLNSKLEAKGRSSNGVVIAIADRAFEAWILADAHGLYVRKRFKQKPKFASFEGKLGAQQRKGAAELTSLLGREYSKTIDGPALFEALHFPTARSNSPSLESLLTALGV